MTGSDGGGGFGGAGGAVTLGVDTHADAHVAAALDERGRLLGIRCVPMTPAGFAEPVAWGGRFGPVAVSRAVRPAPPAVGS